MHAASHCGSGLGVVYCSVWFFTLFSKGVWGEHTIRNGKTFLFQGKYTNYTWPNRDLSSNIDGQIILGALHMIHSRSEDKICGRIMAQGGIQALETMLYTLDYINSNKTNFIPGVKIGVLAKDDCDRDIYGLEQAVDFIRGKNIRALLCFR